MKPSPRSASGKKLSAGIPAPDPALRIETVGVGEVRRFDALLKKHHYLKEGRPVGDYLRQVAVMNGQWVALLAWGPSCYALKDRDQWIGWSVTQRAERLKLVAQNRRFLLLGKKGCQPNLASQVLGASVRALAAQWHQAFGYEPVLAETFTDIERFDGTCYKASGWEAVGMSKGFGRHRADFYVRHDRPKKLWLKRLRSDAKEILCAAQLPLAQEKGGHSNAHGVMPLNESQHRSLAQALEEVADSRKENMQFSMGAVLSVVAMALLCGHWQIAQIVRFGNRLTQSQRKQLGLPRKRKTQFYRMPCYDVYYKLLLRIDSEEFARILSGWLQAHRGTLPSTLALDGKMIRDVIGTVTLADHDQGDACAMSIMSEKKGEGSHCEIKSAQRLLESLPFLDRQIITADALHSQRLTAQIMVEKGGNYFLQIKGNQPKLQAHARQSLEQTPFFPHPMNAATDGSNAVKSPGLPPRRWSRTFRTPVASLRCADGAAPKPIRENRPPDTSSVVVTSRS
jgi:hypothetical protein